MANRWLFKTEPSAYSFRQLVKDGRTVWDGVKNDLELKNLKGIKKGDQILIYHTGDEKAAVGAARALSDAYPDPAKKDPKLLVVEIEADRALPRPVTRSFVRIAHRLRARVGQFNGALGGQDPIGHRRDQRAQFSLRCCDEKHARGIVDDRRGRQRANAPHVLFGLGTRAPISHDKTFH